MMMMMAMTISISLNRHENIKNFFYASKCSNVDKDHNETGNNNINQNLDELYNFDLLNLLKITYKNNSLTNYIIFNNFWLDNYLKHLCVISRYYLICSLELFYDKLDYLNYFFYFNKFFKINLFLVTIYLVFFITSLYTYNRQILEITSFTKFFILNENEKEIDSSDDIFFFVVLFVLSLFLFIFCSFFFFTIQGKFFTWAFASLFLIMVLVLTIPVNLFIDFDLSFFAFIRGSASGNNPIKELLFDIISTFTIFIRFIIQNIRFLFIFSAIFELLEWTFNVNSNIFFAFNVNNKNYILNLLSIKYIFNTSSVSLLIINLFMFLLLYFYYIMHLLFLLLVQIVIYIGISCWLFFFLYSTKFLNKQEKFFLYKKTLKYKAS